MPPQHLEGTLLTRQRHQHELKGASQAQATGGIAAPSQVRKVSSALVPAQGPTPWPAPAPDSVDTKCYSPSACLAARQGWRCVGARKQEMLPTPGPAAPRARGGEPGRGERVTARQHALGPFPSPSARPALLCHCDWCWGHSGTLEPREGGGGRWATVQSSAPHSRGALEAAGTPSSASSNLPAAARIRCSLPQSHLCQERQGPRRYRPSCPSELGRQGRLPALEWAPQEADPPFSGLAGSWIGGGGEIETTPPRSYIHTHNIPAERGLHFTTCFWKRPVLPILTVTPAVARVTVTRLLSAQLRWARI